LDPLRTKAFLHVT